MRTWQATAHTDSSTTTSSSRRTPPSRKCAVSLFPRSSGNPAGIVDSLPLLTRAESGLTRHCTTMQTPTQALARLNEREAYDRAYRLRVASMCAIAHEELPKNERVKPEEVRRDVSGVGLAVCSAAETDPSRYLPFSRFFNPLSLLCPAILP